VGAAEQPDEDEERDVDAGDGEGTEHSWSIGE
jgi:hypothetical protein